MDLRALDEAFTRAVIFWTAIGLVSSLISAWVTYLIIKSAIRDGIKESGLVASWERTAARDRNEPGPTWGDTRPH